jgi:hypothetical protein
MIVVVNMNVDRKSEVVKSLSLESLKIFKTEISSCLVRVVYHGTEGHRAFLSLERERETLRDQTPLFSPLFVSLFNLELRKHGKATIMVDHAVAEALF